MLRFVRTGHTITVRLTPELATWLKDASVKTVFPREKSSVSSWRAERQPDFALVRLIRMSELHPRHPVITVGRGDFRVYRRNKREAIPLICPPG